MKRKHLYGLILAALFVLTFLPVAVNASQNLNIEKDCTLDITFEENGKTFSDVNVQVYQIGKSYSDGSFESVGVFESLPINLQELVMADIEAAVETLDIYIELNDIQPLCTGNTNSEGKIVFEQLKPGLYLVVGEAFSLDGYEYRVESALVFLPTYNNDTGEWIYEASMSPKFHGKPENPDNDTVERKVLKIWVDDGREAVRPASIQVHLLRDGEIYDTVLLSEGNNWRHTWSELDEEYEWTVAEAVPTGYTVSITREGITFVIKNSTEVPPPTTPPPSTPPELPQTGLLWWPVPVFAFLGMILFLIGYICSRRTDGEQ